MELCRGRHSGFVPSVRLRGNSHTDAGGDGAFFARHRRYDGCRDEGNVHIYRPGRPEYHAASGKYGVGGARVFGAQALRRGRGAEIFLHRLDVPLRQTAGGAVSRVSSIRRGGHGRVVSGSGCGGDFARLHAVSKSGALRFGAAHQFHRLPEMSAGVSRGAHFSFPFFGRNALRRLPGAARKESAPRAGLQGGRGERMRPKRAGGHGLSLRRMPREV